VRFSGKREMEALIGEQRRKLIRLKEDVGGDAARVYGYRNPDSRHGAVSRIPGEALSRTLCYALATLISHRAQLR